MTRGDRFAVALLLVASVLFGVVLWAASPAQADTTDDVFIEVLDSEGITYPSSAYAIRAAGIVCDALDAGYSFPQVVNTLVGNSSLTRHQAAYFTGASVAAYCDWNAYLITGAVPA